MRSFLRVVFVLFLFSFHQQGNATRYLPSIVWDHFNPMLSCKCNWFNPIALIEIYDRFEFVCPTPRIHTLLLAKQSRPTDLMNLNIFQRKWKGGIDAKSMNELKAQIMSGDFCDPKHNDTEKIFTCKMGASEGKTIRFAGDVGFRKNDIVVYFNNRNDGRVSSLSKTDKRCAMAFVTRATWNVAEKYDFTYGKNLDNTLPQCKEVNTTCKKEQPTPTPCTNETSSSKMTTKKPITDNEDNNTGNKSTASERPLLGNTAERSSDDDWDSFRYGFLAGFATLLFLTILAALIYCLLCRPQKRKRRKSNCCQATVTKNGKENEAVRKQSKDTGGFSNRAFEPVTPTAPPAEDFDDYVIPKNPHACNGRLPSVETSEHAPNSEKQEDPYEVVT